MCRTNTVSWKQISPCTCSQTNRAYLQQSIFFFTVIVAACWLLTLQHGTACKKSSVSFFWLVGGVFFLNTSGDFSACPGFVEYLYTSDICRFKGARRFQGLKRWNTKDFQQKAEITKATSKTGKNSGNNPVPTPTPAVPPTLWDKAAQEKMLGGSHPPSSPSHSYHNDGNSSSNVSNHSYWRFLLGHHH